MRTFVAVLALFAAGISMAGDEVKKPLPKPIGTWTHATEHGGWQLLIEEKQLVFKSLSPAPEMTATAKNYAISDEGIVYGYVRELTWVVGENKGMSQVVHPFAFRVKIAGEKLTISDLSMRSADAAAHASMTGEYKKETPESAAKPDKTEKR